MNKKETNTDKLRYYVDSSPLQFTLQSTDFMKFLQLTIQSFKPIPFYKAQGTITQREMICL